MDEKKLRELFNEFLKENMNPEGGLFMDELDHYVTIIGTKTRYKFAQRIQTDFLDLTAKHAINISNKLREEARQRIAESNETNCPKDLFDEIRLSVYLDLKQCHQGFIESELFRKHCREQMTEDPDYLSSIGTMKLDMDDSNGGASSDEVSITATTPTDLSSSTLSPTASVKDISSLYDPKVMLVTDLDFQRVLDGIGDTNSWKPIYTSKHRSVSVSKDPVYNGKRGLKQMLEVMTIPFGIDDVLYALMDENYLKVVEKGIMDSKLLSFEKYDQYAATITHNKFRMPMLSKRDFCVLSSIRQEENGSYLWVRKSVEHEQAPESKDFIRAIMFGGSYFEKIDENNTKLTQMTYCDLQGWITPGIFNKLTALRDDTYYNAICASVKERKMIGVLEPFRSAQMVDCLRYAQRCRKRPLRTL
jgi:hypothetical protein